MPPIPLEITGTTRDRYIQAVNLLRLLDPVRGDPTTYGLDQDSPSVHGPFDLGVKRKFLDAFALICAWDKNSDCISAVCFDKDTPSETTIRVASNGGIDGRTLIYLNEILDILSQISTEESTNTAQRTETVILDKIIALDKSRITYYINRLRRANVPEYAAEPLQSALSSAMPSSQPEAIQQFLDWFSIMFTLRASPTTGDSKVIFEWVRWAEKARHKYLKFLRVAITGADRAFPRWVSYVFKLGRYSIASRVLVKTAVEIPRMFASISVKVVPAPRRVPYAIAPTAMPLRSVLRRIPAIVADQALEDLARIWTTDNAEMLFRESCATSLVVHAELQILGFYDENPDLKPLSRFIGVSKKSCYMCSTFLAYHPAGFSVSSCHQKMYLSLPPTASDPKVYKRFKDLTSQLCVRLETIVKEELIERLGMRREHIPADSTAGVTFTGTFGSETWESVQLDEASELDTRRNFLPEYNEDAGVLLRSHRSLTPATPLSIAPSSDHGFLDNQSSRLPIFEASSLVFVYVTQDGRGQDVFMIDSLMSPQTQAPSWSELANLLSLPQDMVLLFRSMDPVTIDAKFQVCNDRHLKACLTYFVKKEVLIVEITVKG